MRTLSSLLLASGLFVGGLNASTGAVIIATEQPNTTHVFEVDKALWQTLTDEQRSLVIQGHNSQSRQAAKQQSQIQQLEKDLAQLRAEFSSKNDEVLELRHKLNVADNEIKRLQSSLHKRPGRCHQHAHIGHKPIIQMPEPAITISFIKRTKLGMIIALSNNTQLFFTPKEYKRVSHWRKGQPVRIAKGKGPKHRVQVSNLDTGEHAHAKRRV